MPRCPFFSIGLGAQIPSEDGVILRELHNIYRMKYPNSFENSQSTLKWEQRRNTVGAVSRLWGASGARSYNALGKR